MISCSLFKANHLIVAGDDALLVVASGLIVGIDDRIRRNTCLMNSSQRMNRNREKLHAHCLENLKFKRHMMLLRITF
jgi:hypothetical protein